MRCEAHAHPNGDENVVVPCDLVAPHERERHAGWLRLTWPDEANPHEHTTEKAEQESQAGA